MTGPAQQPHILGVPARVVVILAVVIGAAIRVALLPAPGYGDDITQFVEWVHHNALNGLPAAYDAPLSFGPVMAYVWGALAAVEPGFRTAVDSSDVWIRVLMKIPATLADFGLAAAAWYALRHRPTWAAAAIAVILLHPTIWFVSAWWGQSESIFAVLVLGAYLLATRGRYVLAAVFLAAGLMTKPQVAPLLLPFAAYFLARVGWRSPASIGRLAGIAVAGIVTIVVLWLPFIPANGPANYLAALAVYQGDIYSVLSLYAWNLWWLVQEIAAGGSLVADGQRFIGPVSFRLAGFLLTGALMLVVAFAVYRRPTVRQLALGLAVAAAVPFTFLTTMHERYGYATVVFLALLLDDRRVRWLSLAFGVVLSLNLVAAASFYYLGGVLPVSGTNGVVGSIAMTATTLLLLYTLVARREPAEAEEGDVDAVSAGAVHSSEGTRPDTSAGSAGATSAA